MERSEIVALQLSGSPYQMGKAHGSAARDAGALDAIRFYGNFVENVFQFRVGGGADRFLRKCGLAVVRQTIEQRLIQQIPTYYLEMIRGFSAGSGVPTEVIARGFVMPDVAAYLVARRSIFVGKSPLVETHLGCTSFVTLGDERSGMPFLHGRNLDFPGGMNWSGHPAVVEYVPEDGQRYVSVASLGVDTAGITAMNESGITLSLNMNYSRRVSSDATPAVIVGHEIVRRAKTLKDAVEILGSFSFSGGWSFLLSSYKEKNAVVAEVDAARVSVRGPTGHRMINTNHYHDPDLQLHEYWISRGKWADSHARYNRVETLLENRKSRITLAEAADVLRDSFDPEAHKERAFVNTISQVHTLTSAIFEPDEQRVYVARGPSLVPHSDYVSFDVFPGPIGRGPVVQALPRTSAHEGRSEYALAHEAYFPSGDLVLATDHLLRAMERNQEEGLYPFVLGLVQLQREQVAEARISFEKAVQKAETEYQVAKAKLFLARTLDLVGDREKALALYGEAAGEHTFRRRGRRGCRKRWKRSDAKGFVIDFTIGDAIEGEWHV